MGLWSTLRSIVGYQADRPGAAAAADTLQLGNLTVQQVHTFNAMLNTFSRTYSFRYDEAMRQDPAFALKMRRDPFLRALLQERLLPLSRWKWSLKPEDPNHKEQADRAKWYESAVRAQPHLSKKLLYLGHAAWYGRYAAQNAYVKERIGKTEGWRVLKHAPVNGDKLVFDWDDHPGVRINPMVAGQYPKDDVTYDDRGGPILMLRRPEYRDKFVVHCHELDDADYFEPEMAGRVKGIGLRDFAYYGAWLRQELIKWAVNFMEKVGTLGLLVFWFPEGNAQAKAQAEAAAKNASNKSAIAIPMPKGADKKSAAVDLIPANMTGVQFLVDIIAGWWERHVERLFVGQSMSAGSDSESGLGGTGRADFAKDTKFNLLNFDAVGLAETMTHDELGPLLRLNGDGGWKLTWEFALPDPEADTKLEAVTKAASLPGKKLEFKASEVRSLTGMSEPGPDDEIVGGDEPQPGVGPDGQPLPGAAAGNPAATADPSSAGVAGGGAGADVLDTLFGGDDGGDRGPVGYDARDWAPHTLQAGPRKGQHVYRNAKTGEVRDDIPAGAKGGGAGEGGDAGGVGGGTNPREHVRSLLERVGSVPKAMRDKAAEYVRAKYEKMKGRYGEAGAKAVMGGMVLMLPIPVPGTSLLPVAIAEGVRALWQSLRGSRPAAAPPGKPSAGYAAADWQPHTLESGPRKGQGAFQNVKTGEIRDTVPAESEPASAGATPAGKPAGQAPTQDTSTARGLLDAAAQGAGMTPGQLRGAAGDAAAEVLGKHDELFGEDEEEPDEPEAPDEPDEGDPPEAHREYESKLAAHEEARGQWEEAVAGIRERNEARGTNNARRRGKATEGRETITGARSSADSAAFADAEEQFDPEKITAAARADIDHHKGAIATARRHFEAAGATAAELTRFDRTSDRHVKGLEKAAGKLAAAAEKHLNARGDLEEAEADAEEELPDEPEEPDEEEAPDEPEEPADELNHFTIGDYANGPDRDDYDTDEEFRADADRHQAERDSWDAGYERWEQEHAAWKDRVKEVGAKNKAARTAHEKARGAWGKASAGVEARNAKRAAKVEKAQERHDATEEAYQEAYSDFDDAMGELDNDLSEAASGIEDAIHERHP